MEWSSFWLGLLALPGIFAAAAILLGIPWLSLGIIAKLWPEYKIDHKDSTNERARWCAFVVSRRISVWGPHGRSAFLVVNRHVKNRPMDSQLFSDILHAIERHDERAGKTH